MLSREECAEHDEDMMFADGFDPALIGVTSEPNVRAVYNIEKMIEILIEQDGLDYEMAIDYLHYNTFGSHIGDKTPIYIKTEI
tara:strand:- start:4885 stop:5133 length:249 start_codon:yes stop_codon:yes gene_type:complete